MTDAIVAKKPHARKIVSAEVPAKVANAKHLNAEGVSKPRASRAKKILAPASKIIAFPHIARKALESTSIRSILTVNFQKPGQTLARRAA